MRTMFIALLAALFSSQVSAQDLSGFWKHESEPAWIEVELDAGTATVVRNDRFPERVGRTILKDLAADGSDDGLWKGQIYAERLGDYKNAEVRLASPERMEITVKVAFRSRTLGWDRVEEVPDAE